MENNAYGVGFGNLVISGIPIDSGLPEGDDWITMTPNGKLADVTVGSDGSTTVNRLYNRSFTVKVKLAGGSSGNDKLTALRNKFLAGNGATGIGSFLYQDLSGRALFEGAHCVPTGEPEQVIGSKRGDTVWEFVVTQMVAYHGGNTSL